MAGLAACVSASSWEAKRVLDDVAAGAGASALKDRTPTPGRETVRYTGDGDGGLADLYHPRQPLGAGLVLVPGFTRMGKDDPRVILLATSLARARFRVLVPDLPGSRAVAYRRHDSERIADALLYLAGVEGGDGHAPPVGIAAISYAVGPAIDAALRRPVAEQLDFLVSLGGYYDAANVVTFITTGRYRSGPGEPWRRGAPRSQAKWIFLLDNLDWLASAADRPVLADIARSRLRRASQATGRRDDLTRRLSAEGRGIMALLENRDPDRAPALIAALPEPVGQRLRALSPSRRDLRPLAGKLVLIHGTRDGLVPPTESEALRAAAGRADLHVIPGFSHIDPGDVGLFGRLALIDAMQAVLARRRP